MFISFSYRSDGHSPPRAHTASIVPIAAQVNAFATSVGLDGVIAHGMLTMGVGASVVEEWAGAGNVADYQARFTRPIPVPALGKTDVQVVAVVAALDHDLKRARIDVTVTCGGAKVLGMQMRQGTLAQLAPPARGADGIDDIGSGHGSSSFHEASNRPCSVAAGIGRISAAPCG